MWQYSVNSTAHPRGNKRQCCSAGDCGSKQPEKCTQAFLPLDHRSVNSTQKSDCNRNRCHCSVQLLINERFRRLQQATGGPDLERGFYCCSLNKYLRFPERTELACAATLQSYLAAHCVEGKPRAPSRVGCSSGVKINEQTGSSVVILNQFVTDLRSASILLEVAYLRAQKWDKHPYATPVIDQAYILQRRGKGLIQDQQS